MRGPVSTVAFVARSIFSLVGGLLGYALATYLLRNGDLTGPNNLLYLTVLGLLVAYLATGTIAQRGARALRHLLRRASHTSPEAILAAGTGITVALLITVLLNNVLATVPGFTWYWSLLIAAILITASSTFFVTNRQLFPFQRAAAASDEEPTGDKVIDTSAIIDGRIADVAEANFLDGSLLIPDFVLGELQRIADSDDPLRRQRGRRGLEVLDRIAKEQTVPTVVIHDDPEASQVDAKLVQVCKLRGADLITTDYNLSRVAALQGVRVLNLHQLANAVKATYLPGENLTLDIVRPGREHGQGLAYLEDGTMVVVEDAGELVGQTVDVVVTSSIQTHMGRMIFARANGAPEEPGAPA